MKYVVWGAGHRGRILYELLGKERIVAFIDSNPEKIGKTYANCPVIDYKTYKEKYTQYVIIVTVTFGRGIVELLEREGIFYFNVENCPPEFMGYGLNRAKLALQGRKLDISGNIILYGSTLYTVLMYEKLQKEEYKNISILFPSTMSDRARDMFAEMFPEVRIIGIDEIGSENILLTEKVQQLEDELVNASVIDIVDWTQYVDAYWNSQIESMKDRYKGRRCFIVATGPSLTYEDLSCLNTHNEFCISMNSIFNCFSQTAWRPDCYVIVDADGVLMWQDQFSKMKDVPYKFIADCQPYFDYTQLDESWYVYHSVLDEFSVKHMLFSDDFSRKVYNGATVVYVCFQLAVYLGFKEIYLLGVDYTYKENARNHFTKQIEPDDTFGGMDLQNKIQDISYVAFKKAQEYASEHDIKIYNATRTSCLDVFEKVKFDTLF